ncbi:MAG: thioredoxin fold domain-containing protein [Casimicrobiaceae bacterium]
MTARSPFRSEGFSLLRAWDPLRRWFFAVALGCASVQGAASAQDPSPHAIDIPPWFTESFLDFRDDIRDATRDHRRLMVYFGQDGCPYCQALMATNFSQRGIVEKTRRHFVAIALNLWGDRETTWIDGRTMSEKALARRLNVQFTPTLLFFDERGKVVARLNGYYPPHRFEAVLDYVSGRHERDMSLAGYLARHVRDPASARLADEAFFLPPPHDLRRSAGGKPLAVLFETIHCGPCDELHREGLQRPQVRALLSQFDVARFAFGAPTRLTTPAGKVTTARAWATELGVTFAPTLVFFAADGREVFRIDAYLRPFHLESSLDYVASGAYRDEPSFQRFIQARAERIRAGGVTVDLWK